jgi:hypothetical protein
MSKWEKKLRSYGSGLNGISSTLPTDRLIENANNHMQREFPGNYIVEDYYDPKTMQFALRLKFNTPKDETFFILRWA